MVLKLAHLCLLTNDLERLATFYRDALGLPVKFRFQAADGAIFGAYIDSGDSTFLEFFDQALAAKQWGGDTSTLQNGNRYQHFCLEVQGLAAFRERLLAKGVAVGELRSGMDGSFQAWLADPDGNRIELMEYTPKSAQRAPGFDGVLKSPR